MAQPPPSGGSSQSPPSKLSGRAFYESIGSPKYIVAPMVDRSEFAWRLLTRSYLDEARSKSMLAYTPMLHARLFKETPRFRDDHFQPTRASLVSKEKSGDQPWLDGNPAIDRPLFVQFCANKPDDLLDAAQYVAPYCDAVDLNLGCPQGIARAGHYGAFLQEDWNTIYKMINKLHNELSVPITAKMRILDTKERTLEYAKMILSAGAQILTVHGRRREQKGHNTGLADWKMIRYLRDNLPPGTVLFANGNILNSTDIEACLSATGADGIMSAEGNLSDPTIFAEPPREHNPREYWYGLDGKGGYRVDAVFRRYLDIIHKYCLGHDPPTRQPLFKPGDERVSTSSSHAPAQPQTSSQPSQEADEPPSKKRKITQKAKPKSDPNLKSIQGHLFQMLRPLVSKHTHIRDALARTRAGDIEGFERVLAMVEGVVRESLIEEDAQKKKKREGTVDKDGDGVEETTADGDELAAAELTPKQRTELIYARPWWVCQPYVRPLPEEALKSGALKISKKDQEKVASSPTAKVDDGGKNDVVRRTDELDLEKEQQQQPLDYAAAELPQPALVCG